LERVVFSLAIPFYSSKVFADVIVALKILLGSPEIFVSSRSAILLLSADVVSFISLLGETSAKCLFYLCSGIGFSRGFLTWTYVGCFGCVYSVRSLFVSLVSSIGFIGAYFSPSVLILDKDLSIIS